MVVGTDDHLHHRHQQQYREDYDREGSVMAGGSYSLREGMVHEGYTRTLPYVLPHFTFFQWRNFQKRIVLNQ